MKIKNSENYPEIFMSDSRTTKNISGRSKNFYGKMKIYFDLKELFPYFVRQILTNLSGRIAL